MQIIWCGVRGVRKYTSHSLQLNTIKGCHRCSGTALQCEITYAPFLQFRTMTPGDWRHTPLAWQPRGSNGAQPKHL